MNVRFTKMHGLGNDFAVVDGTARPVPLPAALRRRLGDRRLGIGFDQLLLVEPSRCADADFAVRIYNADGSEAEHCGNGLRCVARFVRDRALTSNDALRIRTAGGTVGVWFRQHGLVEVEMGVPRFEPADVPFLAGARSASYDLDVGGEVVSVGVVSIGNPHAVVRVDDVHDVAVNEAGSRIQRLAQFPNGVNVGFMQVLGRDSIRLRVCERGVGETLACGSGACAAVVVGADQGSLGSDVSVTLPGGVLRVRWAGAGYPVRLLGPTCTVYQGEIEL